MKKVILIGAGGHAAEVREYIAYHNKVKPKEFIEILGFLDRNENMHQKYKYPEPYLGTAEQHMIEPGVEYMFCFGNMIYKEQLVRHYQEHGATFLTFIHPTALISASSKIGKGVLVSHNASIGPMVEIGDFNILNSRCTIGHDTIMGDFNFISPQVSLSGHTMLGNHNMFGVNSATIPQINIGHYNTIGAGAIITKNIENHCVVVGVPGRVIKRKNI